MQNGRPRKLQRISQACMFPHQRCIHVLKDKDVLTLFRGDLCHRRSIRCRPSNEDGERCQNCYDFDVACTYDRPSKRRKHPQAPSAPPQQQQQQPLTPGSSSSTRAVQVSQGAMFDGEALTNGRMDSLVDRRQAGKAPGRTTTTLSRASDCDDLDPSCITFALTSKRVIVELFDIFMEIVYPL